MKDNKIFYRRNLPHYQPVYATFFITFRLAGSLPPEVIARLKEERQQQEKLLLKIGDEKIKKLEMLNMHKRHFGNFDEMLDKAANNQSWLEDDRIAQVIVDAMHFRDKKTYNLLAYCIMPNHVHMIFTIRRRTSSLYKGKTASGPYVVTKILENLKWYTAMKANEILNCKGAFWQHESYDHVVRDGNELERIVNYVLNNPVRAGLVSSWDQWKWSYVRNCTL
ncbi:MAG: hypothetical protein F9K48_07795 [Candidatus Brocadia sp.]|nr:MAG: hypothetical protein F9K48_07795 [Candidatus Brocadia sp.]